jgi:hypothetical protein
MSFGVEPESVWRISAIAFLVGDTVASSLDVRRWSGVSSLFDRYDHALLMIVTVLSLGADAALLPVALGFFASSAAALYCLALVANLLLSGLIFVRFAASTFAQFHEA